MPSFRRSGRRDESALTDESLAALLSGTQDAPPELRPALDVLAALQAGPARDELADEAAALAEFRINAARPRPASGLRRRPVRLPSLSAKVAAATAVVAVAIGGVATAAVVGVLPGSAQRALHDVLPVIPAHAVRKPETKAARRPGHRSGPAARCGTCAVRHHPSTSDHTGPRRHPRCPRLDPARSWRWWSGWEQASCGAHWHQSRWHPRQRIGWPHFPRRSTPPGRHHQPTGRRSVSRT